MTTDRPPVAGEQLLHRTRSHYDRYPVEFIGASAVPDVRALQPKPFLAFADAWLRPGQRAADIGCGPGRALLLLDALGIVGVGCDLSAVSLDIAAGRTRLARLVQGNALALPLRAGMLDAVICEGVLHHTPDAATGFRELVRVLKPGGVMFVSVYKRWRHYRFLYASLGGLVRQLHRSSTGRRILELTLLPLYHAVHLVKSRGTRTRQAARNFFYDYFATPRASFHTRREVETWARLADLTLVAYDGDIRSNSHSFTFRKPVADEQASGPGEERGGGSGCTGARSGAGHRAPASDALRGVQGSPRSRMKVCVVSSCGGHLTAVRALRPAYARHSYFYVVNARIDLPSDMAGRTTFITHAERDWRVALNFIEAWRILRAERPDVILSAGAGPAVPFAMVGKVLGIPNVYVEDMNRVTKPSLTGRLMYWLADAFFYQWQTLAPYFPRGTYGGPLIGGTGPYAQ